LNTFQDKISSFTISIISTIDRHRIVTTFLLTVAALTLADIATQQLESVLGDTSATGVIAQAAISLMDFAPEVWIGILALVLGTLVIVISIASQSTPKLIDLYMRDWISLSYVWFISLTFIHNLILQFVVGGWVIGRTSSVVLSTGVFLPLSGLLAFPYIFYILGLTRPDYVIQRIHKDNLRQIQVLTQPLMKRALANSRITARHQVSLFGALNQLDDLLEYLSFKEPKARIIRAIGSATRVFVRLKKDIPASFFKISAEARDDISFKTLVEQIDSIEAARTLYSQKVFRVLGNAYQRFLELGDFDMSALCVVQITEIGKVALEEDDKPLVELTFVRFNTLLRFGIKHGTHNSEPRNLYNAIAQYGVFIRTALDQERSEYVEQGCGYLKIYGSEIYRISRSVQNFAVLVDVVAAELKDMLIATAEAGASRELQERLLNLLLQLDSVPEFDKKELQTRTIIFDRVRIVQVSLALFYLREDQQTFAQRIVSDILEDFEYLGAQPLRDAVGETTRSLELAGPTFWEDTDRGNQNIYYSPDTRLLPVFNSMFEDALATLINSKNDPVS